MEQLYDRIFLVISNIEYITKDKIKKHSLYKLWSI